MALYNDAEGKLFQKIYKRVGIRRDRNFSFFQGYLIG